MTASLSLLLKAVLSLTLILVGGCNSSFDDDDEVITFKGLIVSESSLSTRENGQREVYTVKLSVEPTGTVTVTPESGDESVATVSAALSFNADNWDLPKDVTVRTVNNDIDEDTDRSTTITHAVQVEGSNSLPADDATVTVTATDDDRKGVTLSTQSINVVEGGTITYTIKLNSEPTGSVTVTPESSATGVATVSAALAFDADSWNSPKTVTVRTVNNDIDEDTDRSATITHAVEGGDYASVTADDVTVTATDDDRKGVTLSTQSINVVEGGTITYTIKLNSEPTGSVTVTPESSATGVATVSAALAFDADSWNSPKTVTVRTVNNDIDEDTDRSATITHAVEGGDYASVTADDVTVTATDDDGKGVTLSTQSVSAVEGGTTTYTIRLDSEPTGSVRVTPSSSATGVATVPNTALTFNADNWESPKTVTVTTVNNDIDEDTDRSATITHAVEGGDYASVTADDVTVTATDDDGKGVTLSTQPLSAEEGQTTTYTIRLNSEPTGSVRVTPSSSATGVATVPNTALIFNADNWESPKTVTVTTVNNDIDEDTDRSTTITHAFVGGGYDSVSGSVTVTATDNDMRGLCFGTPSDRCLIQPTAAFFENVGTVIYRIKLTSKPTGDVEVSFSSQDTGELTVPSTALTFTSTDWSSFKDVSITLTDNDVADGLRTIIITHTFEGGGYDSVTAPLSVVIFSADDDRLTAGMAARSVNTLSSLEGEGASSFDPTHIEGLSRWLDADDHKTLFSDLSCSTPLGDDGEKPLVCWADKSGRAEHYLSVSATEWPTLSEVLAAQEGREFGEIFVVTDRKGEVDILSFVYPHSLREEETSDGLEEVKEVVIYEELLGESERAKLEGYLMTHRQQELSLKKIIKKHD